MTEPIPDRSCAECGGPMYRKSRNGPLPVRCESCKKRSRLLLAKKVQANARAETAERRRVGVWSTCIECIQEFNHSTKGPKPKWCPTCRYQRLLDRSSPKYEGCKTFVCLGCEMEVTVEHQRHNSRKRCPSCALKARAEARRRYWAKNPDKLKEQQRAHRARRRAAKATAPRIERFSNRSIFERDGWVCGICSTPVDPALEYPDPRSRSLDHIQPLSLGGGHTRDNVRLAHLDCNVSRNNRVDVT